MKHFNFMIIAIMLLFTVIGCQNDLNIQGGNQNRGKITKLQDLVDSTNAGGTIDLGSYGELTDYNATVSKKLIIKNGSTTQAGNITITADGVALYDNSFGSVKVTAPRTAGNAGLKIANSSLSSLTLGSADRSGESQQFITASVKNSKIGTVSMEADGAMVEVADVSTDIGAVKVSAESYVFLDNGGNIISDVSVDNGTLTVYDKTKGMNVMLSFASLPTTRIYPQNAAYSDEGLEVYATYYGGGITVYDVEGGKPFDSFTKRIVDYKSSIANGTSLTILGQQDVKITFEKASITFPIYVYDGTPPTIESITEMTDDVMTHYAKGMALDLSGLRIVAHWSNGEETELGWTSNPANGSPLDTTGDNIEVAVTYQKGNNEDMTFSLPISVIEAKTCDLTFDANNGTNETRTIKVIVNEEMNLPGNSFEPVNEWQRFVGWNTAADGSGTHYNNRAVFTPSANVTLYAEWKDYLLLNKEFDGKIFAKTSEIVVTDRTVTVEGDETIWKRLFDASADKNEIKKGMFGTADIRIDIKPFAMGQFEVTEELYRAVMEDTQYNPQPSRHCSEIEDVSVLADDESADLRPVDHVNLMTAAYFCNVLTEKVMGAEHKVYTIDVIYSNYGEIQDATIQANPDSLGYRLPTRAEWEFAARGGLAAYSDKEHSSWYYAYSGCDTTLDRKVMSLWEVFEVTDDKDPSQQHGYSWFNEYDKAILNDYAWFNHNAGLVVGQGKAGYGTHEVGMKLPNSLGLYDMCGNVCEITGNLTAKDYSKSWQNVGGDFSDLAYSHILIENPKDGLIGFRVVRTLAE